MTTSSPASDSVAIEVRGAHKHYGTLRALDGVDLRVARGEIFGVIGRNGAGKSTLFKLLLGLERPTGGEIDVQGVAVGAAAFRDVRRRIGYLPENVVLYDNLSGLETLRFFARLKQAPPAQCGLLLDELGLGPAALRPVREYSRGMRQRLGFAQALLGTPEVLFLDEPTSGLDPQAARDFHARLRQLRDRGVTIVISSHVLAELQERVDRLAIVSNGRLLAVGSVRELRAQIRMPLTIDLRVVDRDRAEVGATLATVPALELDHTADGLRLRCPEPQRMAVLAAVTALGSRVLDLRIREPSLEDVFLGFTD